MTEEADVGEHLELELKRAILPGLARRELLGRAVDRALEVQIAEAALAALRREETIAAGQALGAKEFHFFGEPDGSLESVPELAGKIAGLIRSVQPDVVFCPDPWARYEAHFDHVTTGRAAAQAMLSAGLAQYPRGTQTAPWQPSAIGFYFTQEPNVVVDVTDTFEAKFAAMALHRSQLSEELLALYRVYFTMQGQQRAQGRGFALGEGFKVLSPLHLHCFTEAPIIGMQS